MKNRLSILIECRCNHRRWVDSNNISDCPKCGRDFSKHEVLDERDHESARIKATAWMMDTGQIDILFDCKIGRAHV